MKNFTRLFLLIVVCLIFSLMMNNITAFDLSPDSKEGKTAGSQGYVQGRTGIEDQPVIDLPEIEAIVSALKTGNPVLLAKYFDSRVDISLPGKSDNYSKKQAEMIMKDFFDQNTVRNFELKHTGENKDGSQFCTGMLQTRAGNFRTILFMKPKGNKLLLQQLSFQEIE